MVALQIPQDAIDSIVQSDFGMGETGESYLIGSDKLMRSNSRLVDTDTVLEQKCGQDYVAKGLNGDIAFDFNAADYDGVPALTAFGFVDLPGGLRWAIVSEIYNSEAYAPINAMVMWISVSALVMVVLVVGLAFVIGRSIGNPLTILAAAAHTMSEGDFRVDIKKNTAKDEIGQMTQAFVGMKDNTRELIEQVTQAATSVASS